MEILYIILVLLVATRVLGELAVRMGQPALTGELLAGVLIGMVVTHQSDTFPVLSELVIADVALRAGIFEVPDPQPPAVASLYSAIVLVAIATTFATPIGLRWIYGSGHTVNTSTSSSSRDDAR